MVEVIARVPVPKLDRVIPFLTTTGINEGETADYGICPCLWKALPEEGIILLKVRHSATTASLLATIVVPTSPVRSTVVTEGSTMGTIKVPIVDNHNTQATAGDVVPTGETTEHLVYYNKCSGVFRLLGVTTTATAPAQTAEAQEAKSVAKTAKQS
ncbi:MAG: hypothetical protein EGP82_00140 [Odoribacter splanchnicus]|nr:hypothetical protein [Odoribacter splanchnicus]